MKEERDHNIPIVAIIGRPNVGKSSLFNRLIQRRVAITSEVAGTTRDRIYHHTEIGEIPAILVDTGGMEYGKKENIEADVQSQARLAMNEADFILFVVDASEVLTSNDYEAAQTLRKSHKPIMMIANKCDHPSVTERMEDFKKLGFGEPIYISTIHKIGFDELFEQLEKRLKKEGWKKQKIMERKAEDVTNICFLGRPNVGKSSLVNALLGEDKLIVSPTAGTTRDAIDIGITWENKKFNLIDTAGIRRRGKIEKGLEKLSMLRSLEAVERTDIACLILDYEAGIAKQDQHITEFITEAGKGLILIVNKSDLMKNREENETKTLWRLKNKFDFLPWAPVIFVSALKKRNIEKILEVSQQIQKERSKMVDTDELEGFMKATIFKHLPPKTGPIKAKIYSLDQTGVNPPTFVFKVNDSKALHFSYRRYLENELRKKYSFTGTSIKIIYAGQEERRREKK